jgi:YHS domain-containing protein
MRIRQLTTRVLCLLAAAAITTVLATGALAAPQVNVDESGAAIKGYDAVAYFTEGKPVKGKAALSHEWNGARWQFSSEENMKLFAANPEKYAPQYGGY